MKFIAGLLFMVFLMSGSVAAADVESLNYTKQVPDYGLETNLGEVLVVQDLSELLVQPEMAEHINHSELRQQIWENSRAQARADIQSSLND